MKYLLLYKPKDKFFKEWGLFQSNNKKDIISFKKGFVKLYKKVDFKILRGQK